MPRNSLCTRVAGLLGLALFVLLFTPGLAFAEGGGVTHVRENIVLNSTEVFLGLVAAGMAFAAAMVFRGGHNKAVGQGMTLVAIGMVIMAIGHLILVIRRVAKVDPLGFLGPKGSVIGFFLAVFCSFTASIIGFWLMRQSRKY